MKRFFLGLAANYNKEDRRAQLFSVGRKEDYTDLEQFLKRKYIGQKAVLTKNGRSALTLALKAYFNQGDKILVNGFTCFAVYEAVKAAKLEPVFADIELNNLNFSEKTVLKSLIPDIKGIIIQNTLGNPIDIEKIEKIAKENNLTIIEDLAHCAGIKYSDGREAGTIGAATILSFGKEKAIDTVSGGAVVFRDDYQNEINLPTKSPRFSDYLRSRFYPTFGAICRNLTHVHLGGFLMKALIKIHWVEKSADSKLDLSRKPSKFEARRALIQIKSLSKTGEKPLRDFYYVNNRGEVLNKLKKAGYYFDSFWYEKPISPIRYYSKTHFPEELCPNAVYAANHIINFPKYYKKPDLKKAQEIIKDYLETKE